MRFNLLNEAPQIELEVGNPVEKILLRSRLMTASERMTMLDLLSSGIAPAMQFAWSFLVDWEGVQNEKGHKINIDAEFIRPGTTAAVSAVEMVFGRLPLAKQIEAWLFLMVINGVDFKGIAPAVSEIVGEDAMKRLEKLSGPLGSAPAHAGMKSSVKSSTIGTSPGQPASSAALTS